jgi:hypothetical protein
MIVLSTSGGAERLVIGTGNKTEALLGYTTLYGDSAAALHPIGDYINIRWVACAGARAGGHMEGTQRIGLARPTKAKWV